MIRKIELSKNYSFLSFHTCLVVKKDHSLKNVDPEEESHIKHVWVSYNYFYSKLSSDFIGWSIVQAQTIFS